MFNSNCILWLISCYGDYRIVWIKIHCCVVGKSENVDSFGGHAVYAVYIICNWLTPSISNKSLCSYAVGYLTQYIKIKHEGNILINGAQANKC